jgi:hypothetical protein
MNLRETIQALEAKGITVANDLGVHENCAIDSNCPKAIEVRKIIGESGVTLEQLLEGFTQPEVESPAIELPEINGDAEISVAGRRLKLDFNSIIKDELRSLIRRKLSQIEEHSGHLKNIGYGWNSYYQREIARVRTTKVLPQLSFPIEELSRTGCMITSQGDNYVFLFKTEYHPEYIVSDGVRFKLSDNDTALLKGDTMLKYVITRERKFLTKPALLNDKGSKFYHYHGSGSDCWGTITFPTTWDGTLNSLYQESITLMKSLITINRNSPMNREPAGMPNLQDLFSRATRLGMEGVIDRPIPPVETPQDDGSRFTTDIPQPVRGWGRRA